MPKAYNPQNFELAIDKRGCLYIEGDPKKDGAEICFKRRAPSKRYCPEHTELARRKPPGRKPAE